jgi:hypothetical protein
VELKMNDYMVKWISEYIISIPEGTSVFQFDRHSSHKSKPNLDLLKKIGLIPILISQSVAKYYSICDHSIFTIFKSKMDDL